MEHFFITVDGKETVDKPWCFAVAEKRARELAKANMGKWVNVNFENKDGTSESYFGVIAYTGEICAEWISDDINPMVKG